jgi:hypothetical protein
MTGYTKLFGLIIASSIWDEDDKTRLVWITMLALKDRGHIVNATEKALSLFARVSEEECHRSIEKFLSPDPLSRTPDHEGRRIEVVPGGWRILNGEVYAKMLTKEERRQYNAAKQSEHRRRSKEIVHAGACDGAGRAIEEGMGRQKCRKEVSDGCSCALQDGHSGACESDKMNKRTDPWIPH